MRRWIVRAAVAGVIVAVPGAAGAQPVAAPFPVGKPVSVYLGFEPGGGNDQITRLIARNIGRHLPGSPMRRLRPSSEPSSSSRRIDCYFAEFFT